MNQFTWDELVQVVSQGRKMVVALPDFEMESAWHDNGPTCASQVDYGSGNILAATWNVELADLMGRMIGDECLWIGRHGWYGPSINIHRSRFRGFRAHHVAHARRGGERRHLHDEQQHADDGHDVRDGAPSRLLQDHDFGQAELGSLHEQHGAVR